MIIGALVKRYEDTQTVLQGWKKRAVSYALNLSENGELLGVIPLEWEDTIVLGGKEKKTLRKLELVLPEPEVRSSGIKAAFLCDDASYLFGIDEKRGTAKFAADKELHLRILESVESPSAQAIKAWFSTGIKTTDTEIIQTAIPNEKVLSQALFVFHVNGKHVDYDDPDMRTAWESEYFSTSEQNEEKMLCLITGKHTTPERIHGKIKLRGGQSAGSNLVSINAESFASYGKTAKDRAADIGKYAAFAHVTALNDLLQDEKHRQFIGTDTLVYWADENSKPETKAFGELLNIPANSQEEDTTDDYWDIPIQESDSDKLSDIAEKVANAKYFDFDNCDMNCKFYLLCLSPNAARVSIRFFYVSTFGEIVNNLRSHYNNLKIASDNRTKFSNLPYWIILNETTATVKKESSKVAPLLGGQLIQSIIKGITYPQTLYNAMLIRIRAGEEINQTKAAVIKAVLIKNFNEKEVTTVELNKETCNKPYVLGRLFAVLEQLQYRAQGSLNSNIRDRYFASACANPNNVFPTLLKLSMHHTAKLDNATCFEKSKGELLVKLDDPNPFPSALSMGDQGRFILGYYHQKQAFFAKKEESHE